VTQRAASGNRSAESHARLVRVASLRELERTGRWTVQIEGEEVLLLKTADLVVAVGSRCPHLGAPLSGSRVEGTTILCSGHGWKFDLCTAGVVKHWWQRSSPPGRRVRLKVYRVVVENDEILVEVTDARRAAAVRNPAAGRETALYSCASAPTGSLEIDNQDVRQQPTAQTEAGPAPE
jgi:nitrite reductase/ring-hydroxylating ferredoxin subunit